MTFELYSGRHPLTQRNGKPVPFSTVGSRQPFGIGQTTGPSQFSLALEARTANKPFASVTADGDVSIDWPGVEAAAVGGDIGVKAIAQLLLAARKAGAQ